MNASTHRFLTKFMAKLEEVYHAERSSGYLDKMNKHLNTYYDDVLEELEKEKEELLITINGECHVC